MRIGIGKSFGSLHVGTSVSTKGLGKGVILLFTWPFYMLYYLCIWPFVAIYRAVTKKKKINKKTLIAEANRYIQILQDSSKICRDTKNPETFFSRMDLIEETLKKMVSIEKDVPFTGSKPSVLLKEFNQNKANEINDFVERYARDTRIKIYDLKTKSGKINKANAFYYTLNEYSAKMPNECVINLTQKAQQLKELASTDLD